MSRKFPPWLKKRLPQKEQIAEVKQILTELNLNTVCQSAECPNRGECFAAQTATFMILGDICTRNCRFCAVPTGRPKEVDPFEPANVAKAVSRLGLKHVVITSVTRDDLAKGGVNQFIQTAEKIKQNSPKTTVELLTPDFQGQKDVIQKLVTTEFEVFNHNVETVPRLYKDVRPEADYQQSLEVLKTVKELKPQLYTKSGFMVGLGERKEEIVQLLEDLQEVNCDILTIGQYLQPSPDHLEVKKFVRPAEFAKYKLIAEEMGFKAVASGPFVRSSYQAAELFRNIR